MRAAHTYGTGQRTKPFYTAAPHGCHAPRRSRRRAGEGPAEGSQPSASRRLGRLGNLCPQRAPHSGSVLFFHSSSLYMRVVGLKGGWAPGSTVAGIRGPPALGQVFTLLQAVGWLTWAGPAWGQEETGGEPWAGAGRGPRRTRQPCAQRPHSPRGGRWRPRGREHGHATLLRTRPVPGSPWRGLPPRPAPAAAFARLPGLQAPSPSGCTSFLETTQVASPLFPVTSGHALVGGSLSGDRAL